MKGRKTGSSVSDPFGLAVELLARRDYSRSALLRKLIERGVEAGGAEEAVERCSDLGYLDDERYAGAVARTLVGSGRAVGPRLLLELRKRGISDGLARRVAAETVADLAAEEGIAGLIRERYERRFGGVDFSAADQRQRKRIIDYFLRRGFTAGQVLDALLQRER